MFAALIGAAACAPKLTDQDHLRNAQEFLKKNEPRAALIEFKNALQKNPQNRDARWGLGNLYLDIGNGVAAEKELRRAEELGVARDAAWPALARALLIQRRYDAVIEMCAGTGIAELDASAEGSAVCAEAWANSGQQDLALRAIQRAIELDRNALSVLRSAVRVSVAANNVAAAQDWVRAALERGPDDPESWLLLGDLAFVGSRHEEAVRAYEKVIVLDQRALTTARSLRARIGLVFSLLSTNRDDVALPHIEALLKANPRYFLFNYLRGLAAFKKADYPSALDFLQRSVKDSRIDSPAVAMLGAVHYAIGNLQQADLYLTKYINAVPEDIRARKLLGAVRMKLNQPDKALEALAAGSPSAPDDAELLRMLGEAAAMSGDFREGREYFKRALTSMPDSGALRTQIAQTYLSEGDYERGLRELEQAGKDASSAVRARVLTILAMLRHGDRNGALRAAQTLAGEFPRQPVPHNILGGVHLALDDRPKAREAFKRAVELDGKFVMALLNLALVEQRERNFKAAREHLNRALQVEPRNIDAMVKLAQIEEQENRQAAAIDWLEKARKADSTALTPRLLLARYRLRLGQAEDAEVIGLEAVATQPSNSLALLLLGDAQMARKAYDRAQITFESLTRAQPKDPAGFLRLGTVNLQRQQFAAARQNFRRAMELQPDLFAAVASLAALEMRDAKPGEAMRLADDFLRRRPGAPEGLTLRGDVLVAQGRFDAAEETYARAAQKQNTPVLAAKRAQALLQTPRASNAIDVLNAWLKDHPRDELITQTLADAYRKMGRLKEAAETYNWLLAQRPDNIGVLNNLALVYLATGDARAREVAEKAYNLLPGHPYVMDTYGWILLQAGDRKKAISLLAQAFERAKQNADIQTHYAIALEKNGDASRAREIVEAALQSERPFEARPLAEALRKKLK